MAESSRRVFSTPDNNYVLASGWENEFSGSACAPVAQRNIPCSFEYETYCTFKDTKSFAQAKLGKLQFPVAKRTIVPFILAFRLT